MSDPAKKPPADPWSQYVPTDWNKVSWLNALSQAPKNLGPSIRRDVTQMVAPFLPKNWESDATTAKALALGLGSKLTPARYFESPAQRARLDAPVDAVADYYRKRYMTAPGLKQAIATDPFGTALDVSGAASIPASAESLVARVPGIAGRAARTATGTAAMVRDVANPSSLVGKAASASVRGARRVWQGPLTDKTGAFSPEVRAAIQQAFPNGAIGDSELADPAFRQALTQSLQAKGVSPAAVKEAVLAYHGAPTPRSLVTGKVPPKAVQETTQALVDQGRQKLGAAAQALSGVDRGPSPSALGAALQDAHLASKNGYQAAYKQAFSHEGAFAPEFVAGLPDQITAALKKSNLPTTPEDLAKYPSLKQSQAALDWLHPHLADLAQNDALTLPNLERARQELGDFRMDAKGTDRRAVGSIIEGLDKHIQASAPNPELFPVENGPQIAEDMKAARDAYKAHQANFASRANTTDSTIARAVREFADQGVDENGMSTPARGGSEQAAQSVLTNAMIHPKTLVVKPGADKLYGKLSDLLSPDGQAALRDHLRQTALATDDEGKLLANSDKLGNFLGSPLADAVYSPDELSKVRLLGAASDVLGTRPHLRSESLSEATGPILGGIAGYGAAKLVGAPGELGAGIGVATEKPLEMIKGAMQRSAERSGAKPDLPGARKLEAAANLTAAAGQAAPLAHAATETRNAVERAAPEPVKPANDTPPPEVAPPANEDVDWSQYLKPPEAAEQADGGRIERKDGGRVDDRTETLVKRLLAAHAKARSQTKAATKPLLNVPDEHVARALDIAQQAI